MKKENRITPSFISVPGGPVLGLTDTPLLDVDGLKFKDLERCGELLPYEDWRLNCRVCRFRQLTERRVFRSPERKPGQSAISFMR